MRCVMVSVARPFGSSAKFLKYVVTLKSKTMCREDRRKRRRQRGSWKRDPKRKRVRGSGYTAAETPRLGLYVLLLSPGTAFDALNRLIGRPAALLFRRDTW